jgi:hypothetical protein
MLSLDLVGYLFLKYKYFSIASEKTHSAKNNPSVLSNFVKKSQVIHEKLF